jgi:hypothetical protein
MRAEGILVMLRFRGDRRVEKHSEISNTHWQWSHGNGTDLYGRVRDRVQAKAPP